MGLFKLVRSTMIFNGLWRLGTDNLSTSQKKLYILYSIFAQIVYVSTPVLLAANFPKLFRTDVTAGIEALSKFFYAVLIITKVFVYQSESIRQLLSNAIHEESILFDENDVVGCKIYKRHVLFCSKLSKFLFFSAIFGGSLLIEMGLVSTYKYTGNQKHSNQSLEIYLPLTLWYPVDVNKYYNWLLLEQIVDIVLTSTCAPTLQIFATTLLIFIQAELEILQYHFRNLGCLDSTNLNTISYDVARNLKLLCRKHQKLIKYVMAVNKCFTHVMFLEYSVSSVMLATAVCQVIASGALATALYESKWYEQCYHTQVLLQIMLMRSQKPLSMSIGPFGSLTADAAMSRVRMAYSYTTVMTGN
ncbi:uncharacterized protein LOC132697080 isoform X2 [Cylas formicarius]|uniref:uncharacterized protein LOC132697080 isoform X2 n=1 Tax=Cylas formicarius TaxID=197179 RepID=UPI002958BEAE|nr:uncharacterized protein LOC132697080 isoform X2 [Cylas formicarius]